MGKQQNNKSTKGTKNNNGVLVRKNTGFTKAGRNSKSGGKNQGAHKQRTGGRVATGNGYGAAEQRHRQNNHQQGAVPNEGYVPEKLVDQALRAAEIGNFAELPEWEREIAVTFSFAWQSATVKRNPMTGKPIEPRNSLATEAVLRDLRMNERANEASSAQVAQLLQSIRATFKEAGDQMYANA